MAVSYEGCASACSETPVGNSNEVAKLMEQRRTTLGISILVDTHLICLFLLKFLLSIEVIN